MKRCLVVYATPGRQFEWSVDLADAATVADALAAACSQANMPELPWDSAPVGIFGERCERSATPRDADRIEMYRALRSDPRARRREQVQRERQRRGS
ncbi:MAG: RnfH family protein [Sinobacteraceae bacterium]|nr:RnfH family protein [Nevskiaceae bacterium]